MSNRTTGLAGSFALLFVGHLAVAQSRSPRPVRIGVVAPSVQPAPVAVAWSRASAARPAYAPARMTPAPRAAARIAPIAVAAPQPVEPANVRRFDPRPVGPFSDHPGTVQPQPVGVRAAPNRPSPVRGSKPRIGVIYPSPPAQPQDQFGQTVFSRQPSFGFPQVAQFYFLPAVVLNDGRIFANFNGSYEEVLRRCPAFSGALPPNFTTTACWTIDQYGRYTVVQPRW